MKLRVLVFSYQSPCCVKSYRWQSMIVPYPCCVYAQSPSCHPTSSSHTENIKGLLSLPHPFFPLPPLNATFSAPSIAPISCRATCLSLISVCNRWRRQTWVTSALTVGVSLGCHWRRGSQTHLDPMWWCECMCTLKAWGRPYGSRRVLCFVLTEQFIDIDVVEDCMIWPQCQCKEPFFPLIWLNCCTRQQWLTSTWFPLSDLVLQLQLQLYVCVLENASVHTNVCHV